MHESLMAAFDSMVLEKELYRNFIGYITNPCPVLVVNGKEKRGMQLPPERQRAVDICRAAFITIF